MENRDYIPPVEKLLRYFRPDDRPFHWLGGFEDVPFNDKLFIEIRELCLINDMPSGPEMVSAFYWVVTEYIGLYATHVDLQKISDVHLADNQTVLRAIQLIEHAEAGKAKFTVLLRAGDESVSTADPGLINEIKRYLQDQKERILEKDNVQKSDYKNQPYEEGMKALDAYLIAEEIDSKRTRAKVIGYLYSLAEIPVRGTVEVEGKLSKKPISHRSKEFDEESMIKSVLYWLSK